MLYHKMRVSFVLLISVSFLFCFSGCVDNTIIVEPSNLDSMATFNVNVSGVNYSFEEKKVGKWVDGRDIYEKTIAARVEGSNVSGFLTIIGSHTDPNTSVITRSMDIRIASITVLNSYLPSPNFADSGNLVLVGAEMFLEYQGIGYVTRSSDFYFFTSDSPYLRFNFSLPYYFPTNPNFDPYNSWNIYLTLRYTKD
jgi:hypothetical protein